MSLIEESLLRTSIDHLLEGVQVLGFDWTYLYVNETAAGHGQQSATALLGRTMMAAYPGIEATDMFAMLRRVMDTRRQEQMLNEFTFPSGERRWFRLLVEPVPAGICVLSLDVTDVRRGELQLQQAQKLEAIGQLAGGIAHDFNNILTAILGYSELIADQIGPDKPIGRDLEEIAAAARRAATLTKKLLAFSRSHHTKPGALSLHQSIAELDPMLRRLVPENISMCLDLTATADTIWAEVTQVEQILLNLAVNARDAMPGGGALTIGTRNATHDDVAGRVAERRARLTPYVVLSVADTGVGIPPEVRSRIFEPFYTTKPQGQGTGLGLAAVADIVARLGGDIRVESSPGAGATFEIVLPTTTEAPGKREMREWQGASVGHENILLVEDEPGVRSFAATVLKRHGYRVLEAGSAEAAIAALGTREHKPMDMLITDVILPGLDGVTLAERVAGSDQNVPVLFISGYSQPVGVVLPDGTDVLLKPFSGRTLLSRVRAAIDAR
jgi:two-component system cell cycle sensor histidine kinase/response regulator CckA